MIKVLEIIQYKETKVNFYIVLYNGCIYYIYHYDLVEPYSDYIKLLREKEHGVVNDTYKAIFDRMTYYEIQLRTDKFDLLLHD